MKYSEPKNGRIDYRIFVRNIFEGKRAQWLYISIKLIINKWGVVSLHPMAFRCPNKSIYPKSTPSNKYKNINSHFQKILELSQIY